VRLQKNSKTQTSSPQPPRKSATQPSLRGRALRLLGRRELSRLELAARLRQYVDAEKSGELDALLDDLTERGWLSDARYAEAVVRKRTGQYARRSIAQQLKRAGVDEEVTAAALVQNPESDPDEEFAAALALCRRKFRKAPIEQKEKARQMRFLQSRGYSFSLALRVLNVLKQSGAVDNNSEDA
jgi:regulatory protein